MSRQSRPTCLGFTLVELLVAMIIIAILFALVIPAVNSVRNAARRTGSQNNLRQIGLAMANYEGSHKYFPASWRQPTGSTLGSADGWSTHAQLLPYLEQAVVMSKIDFAQSYNNAPQVKTADGNLVKLSALRVPVYVSPFEPKDEPKLTNGLPTHYPLNYAFNLGPWFVWNPATSEGGTGAFYPNSRLPASAFQDGLGFTLCAAEVKSRNPCYRNGTGAKTTPPSTPSELLGYGGDLKTDSGHTEWVDGRASQTGFTTTFPPNTQILVTQDGVDYDVDWVSQQEGKSATVLTYAAVTARSYLPGSVQVVMMDGTVKAIDDSIHPGVWRALSTRADKEILPSENSK